jgi:phosphatidylglycerophosphate synthase
MTCPTVSIPASPFLRQQMGGLSGIARSVILADLAGATEIRVIAQGPVGEDWRRSFACRERNLPTVVYGGDAAGLILPSDRLMTREGMVRLLGGEPIDALVEGRDWLGGDAPGMVTSRLLQATMKAGEGPVGRLINRPFSFRIAALLMRANVTPNAVTWFTLALAIAMAVVLGQGGLICLAIGGLLYQLVSMVDCIDGDIARVTFQTSRSGATLDTAFDVLANASFAIGLAVGITRTYGSHYLYYALAMLGIGITCVAILSLLIRMGPRRGSFDVLRAALNERLAGAPRLRRVVMTAEKAFKRDVYALVMALLCLAGLAWSIPQIAVGGLGIWLLAILWCAPQIAADKTGRLLPAHLREAEPVP